MFNNLKIQFHNWKEERQFLKCCNSKINNPKLKRGVCCVKSTIENNKIHRYSIYYNNNTGSWTINENWRTRSEVK